MQPGAIPEPFAACMLEVYGEDGRRWTDALPQLLLSLAEQWGITLGPPFELTYNYVARATRDDGSGAVIKVGYPSGELPAEMAAVEYFSGRGGVRVLASDHARGALLLEQLTPGDPLTTVADDAEATRIAVRLVSQAWRPPPEHHQFPAVADWGRGFERMRRAFDGGAGPFPPAIADEAEATFAEFVANSASPVVLHGDFHHLNILTAGNGEWRLIDPKGLIGEPAYEAGTFLQNPRALFRSSEVTDEVLAEILARRLDIFSEEFEVERERLRRWGVAQSVLSAWWSYEDHGHGWEPAIRAARLLAGLG